MDACTAKFAVRSSVPNPLAVSFSFVFIQVRVLILCIHTVSSPLVYREYLARRLAGSWSVELDSDGRRTMHETRTTPGIALTYLSKPVISTS